MIHKTTRKMVAVGTLLFASSAFADGLSWQYIDARYQQPSDDSTKGFGGEVSGHISENWILQSRVNHLKLSERDLDLEISQSRFDLSVGRKFDFGSRISTLVSGGYTRLQYDLEVGSLGEDYGADLANVQIAVRGKLTKKFNAEASIGMLFDDEDTSDLLWNAALRYRMFPNLSFTLGANGVDDENFESDDILYEIGFRFDLPRG